MNPIVDITPFSITWIIGIIAVIVAIILIIQFAIRVPPDTRRILSITLGMILILRELWKNWYIFNLGIW